MQTSTLYVHNTNVKAHVLLPLFCVASQPTDMHSPTHIVLLDCLPREVEDGPGHDPLLEHVADLEVCRQQGLGLLVQCVPLLLGGG